MRRPAPQLPDPIRPVDPPVCPALRPERAYGQGDRVISTLDGGWTMAEKSSRKAVAKPAARSLKEKRLDKKNKKDSSSDAGDVVSNANRKR